MAWSHRVTRKLVLLPLLALFALAVLTGLIVDGNKSLSIKLAKMLYDREQFVFQLVRYYQDGGSRVKIQVLKELGRMKEGPSAELLALVRQDDSATRDIVLEIFFRLENPPAHELIALFSRNPSLSLQVETVLIRTGPEAVGALQGLMGNPDLQVRWWALHWVGRIGPPAGKAADKVNNVLVNDLNPSIQTAAASALGDLGSASSKYAPSLLDALEKPHPDVRAAAAVALGRLGPAAHTALPNLTLALLDEDAIVRENACEALLKIQGNAAAP